MKTAPPLMPAFELWLVGLEDSTFWLLERKGDEVSGQVVTRPQLQAASPRLFASLRRRETPYIVVERLS